MSIFNFLKREEQPLVDAMLESFASEREIEAKQKLRSILDRAADAVTNLRAYALDEIAKIDAKISNLEGEISDLVERRRQSAVVLGMSEGGLKHLEANATVDAPPAPAVAVAAE